MIVEAAEELAADLVVLATRGRTDLSYLLLGSNNRRVVQRSPCPVLTVHAEDPAPARPLRTVVLPTDFHLAAVAAAETAVRVFGIGREDIASRLTSKPSSPSPALIRAMAFMNARRVTRGAIVSARGSRQTT